jgi:hypothetical protein
MTSPTGGMSNVGGVDVNSLIQKLRRLAMLDTTVFEEVKGDASATIPALVVAVLATVLAGLGGWFWWLFTDHLTDYKGGGTIFFQTVVLGSILSVALWFVWVGLTYVMLQQVFRARADLQEMIRVMGFAAAPMALVVLVFVPVLGWGLGLGALALLFGTNVLAVQTVTDAPAGRVLVSNAAGFAVWVIILGLFVSDSHVYAPGFFIFRLPVEYFSR